MSAVRRVWLERQLASARGLAFEQDPSGPFGDGGMAAHVADLERQLAELDRPTWRELAASWLVALTLAPFAVVWCVGERIRRWLPRRTTR